MATQYIVLTSRLDEAPASFFGRVADQMRQGWACQGGVSVTVYHPTSDNGVSPAIAGVMNQATGKFSASLSHTLVYSQAMVK